MADPRRILIIDDNLALAENIAEILQLNGYATDVAESPEAAMNIACKNQPDVVVTDYRLPGVNGTGLLKQLRAMGLCPRAIVISAFSDYRTMEEARDAGAAFLAKPLDLTVLGSLIQGQNE